MNAISRAQRAYSAASIPTRTGRDTEYDAMARITRRMRSAVEGGATGFAELAAALHDNSRLWGIFATEAADPANTLPAELRARLFYLAEFTIQHTPKVLAGQAGAEPLLDINTAIMRGLRGGAT